MIRLGDTIDHYRIVEALGSGGYGMVFSAENTVSQQRVALKLVPLCGRAGNRELNALRQYRDLDHPNLLKIYHAGIFGDYLYYTMELAEGKLADQHLSPAALRAAAVKIADALAFLHSHHLLHRDIKPDNLFFLRGEPLLGDVGLLTASDGASLAGSAGFLAPEVCRNGTPLSERSDLYALAKSFYCLLSGNRPEAYPRYDGPLEPDASVLLRAVLSVCDGEKRLRSAADFRDHLIRAKVPRRRKGIRLLLKIASGLFALLILAAMCVAISRNRARRLAAAEDAAIDRQLRTFAELKAEAKKLTQSKFPYKARVSTKEVLAAHSYLDGQLKEMVRRRAETDREFRCFYVMKNELDVAESRWEILRRLPESSPERQAAQENWRRQDAAYRAERDALLH